MDDTEYWTIGEYKGTNLLQTMVHELGHSLGLSHSDVRDAIMAPFYRGWDPNFKLSADDKRAIQALYGKKVNKTPKREVFTTLRPNIFRQPRPLVLKIFVPTPKLMPWSRHVILPHIFSRTPTTGN